MKKYGSFLITDMLIKIVSLAVIATLITVILKKHCKELVPFFELAVLIAVLLLMADGKLINNSSFEKLFSLYVRDNEMFSAIFKAAAITVLTRLASDLCKENGNTLMGDIVELGGRIMLTVLALPFIEKVTETALSFV